MSLDTGHWPSPVAIAHRGSRLMWPENTIEAFRGAYALGVRHFETDLHLTSDGSLVCFHDANVDRTTEGTGPVESFTLSELQDLDAGYRHSVEGAFPFRGRGCRVPALAEVLDEFPDVNLVVDLKREGMAPSLAALISDRGMEDRIIVGSFHDRRLEEFRSETSGRVPTSTGSVSSRSWLLASRVGRGGGGEAKALQLPARMRGVRVVDAKLIDIAHRHGLHVHVWTVNERSEMESLLDIGVDGLVTDRPDILREVLTERGRP